MKRSKKISTLFMRKTPGLSLLGAGAVLTGCSDDPNTVIYANLQECVRENPENAQYCESSFEKAKREFYNSAPRYTTMSDCEYEFGAFECHQHPQMSQYWIPAMTGLAFAYHYNKRKLDTNDRETQSLMTSYSSGSSFYNRWVTTEGREVGYRWDKSLYLNESERRRPSRPATTIKSRGGFGRSIAKVSSRNSSWGS